MTNTTTTTSFAAPRESLSARIAALGTANAKALASFITSGDKGGALPCWGAIVQRFDATFAGDDERIALLDQLVAEGDRRALYVFLSANRTRPKVLEALCAKAKAMPVSVQRALVAMPEAATSVSAHLDALDPAAREVWSGGEDAKAPERELLASRVGELTAFAYFVADHIDPTKEAASMKSASTTTTKRGG
jgi:hypothetical protein